MKTNLLVEQHFHGCYGIDFNLASVDEMLDVSAKIIKEGVGFIFPTLVTDTVENINRQVKVIQEAAQRQTADMAKICGVHLEGVFLNPEKKCIHDANLFLKPTVENLKKVENDFIKIITLAPELADPDSFEYLKNKGVKVQAGHCVGGNLKGCNATTHTFNGMKGVVHRGESTALSALINDDIYTEVIADGVHVSDDALRLLFKVKPMNKVILVSDCLSCTHSNIKEFDFAGSKIYFDGHEATSKEGTIAGSTKLLPDIIKILGNKGLFNKQYIANSYDYHSLSQRGEIEWDEDYNIVKVNY